MIVITNNDGQLCNQFILFAHCVATGMETGQCVVNLAGRDIVKSATLEPQILKRRGIWFFSWMTRWPLDKMWWKLTDWIQKAQGVKLKHYKRKTFAESKAYIEQCFTPHGGRRLFMINDWHFRNHGALARHHDEIVGLLSLKKEFYNKPVEIISGIRKAHPGIEIIGVHIRRGDYQTYSNGRWFYPDGVYASLMREAAAASPATPAFLICSDEPANLVFFKQCGMVVYAGPGHKIEDLAALSLCDKIMGPPSTYSWWAAFVSNIPLWHVWDASQPAKSPNFIMLSPSDWP